MPYRVHSLWISYKMTDLYGLNFCGFWSDRAALAAEIAAAEEVIAAQPHGSMLVSVDVSQSDFFPELVEFFARAGQPNNHFRKIAIVGVSGLQRAWLRWRKHVVWPPQARFFDGQEPAKRWLVGESF